jgi:hypothetical protein
MIHSYPSSLAKGYSLLLSNKVHLCYPRVTIHFSPSLTLWSRVDRKLWLTKFSAARAVRLIDYLQFYVPLKIFHLYGDVTIAGEGLQNLGLPHIRFFFAFRKFCEKRVNLYISYFAEVIFCDLKRYIGIFMAHNHEHNFYVFYFWRIKYGHEKCEN